MNLDERNRKQTQAPPTNPPIKKKNVNAHMIKDMAKRQINFDQEQNKPDQDKEMEADPPSTPPVEGASLQK